MRVASISEAKNQFSALIDQVRSGESVLIVDRGIPVAVIEPAILKGETEGRLARLQRAGVVRPARKELPIELLRQEPPRARGNASIVQAVLEERRSGR